MRLVYFFLVSKQPFLDAMGIKLVLYQVIVKYFSWYDKSFYWQVTKLVLTVVTVFIFCWLPHWVTQASFECCLLDFFWGFVGFASSLGHSGKLRKHVSTPFKCCLFVCVICWIIFLTGKLWKHLMSSPFLCCLFLSFFLLLFVRFVCRSSVGFLTLSHRQSLKALDVYIFLVFFV